MARIDTTTVISTNSVRHNGGTAIVFRTTAAAGAPITNPLSYTTIAKPGQPVAKYLPAGPWTVGEQGDRNHRTAKISTSSSRFGSQVAGKYIINLVTREIAGLSDTRLLGAGIQNRTGSNTLRESVRSKRTSGATFNGYTGQYTAFVDTQLDEYKMLGGTLSDNAARPTLSIPGEFVVLYGIKSDPQLKDYRAVTG
jgi:hypothetical protein